MTQCTKRVLTKGMNSPIYHQCSRAATEGEFCALHSEKGEEKRRKKQDDNYERRLQRQKILNGYPFIIALRRIADGAANPARIAQRCLKKEIGQ